MILFLTEMMTVSEPGVVVVVVVRATQVNVSPAAAGPRAWLAAINPSDPDPRQNLTTTNLLR